MPATIHSAIVVLIAASIGVAAGSAVSEPTAARPLRLMIPSGGGEQTPHN